MGRVTYSIIAALEYVPSSSSSRIPRNILHFTTGDRFPPGATPHLVVAAMMTIWWWRAALHSRRRLVLLIRVALLLAPSHSN